ncbi:MAG TPA: chalcone isomerase family protein [Burkholderiaceae bacterium]|nr:chalcone isomerase family protein [Burkholderiaceae bacterium]
MTKWVRADLMIGLMGLIATMSLQAQPVEMEGQKFEPTVQVGEQTLQLNGIGLRRRAIFKVYVAGLYVPQKSTNAATLINDKRARRVALRMLRDVDSDSFIDAFNDGLKNNLIESQLAVLKPQIDALTATLKSIGEAKKGDAINFDYTPGSGTVISVNGTARGNPIPTAEFFAVLLRIWLGDKPVDEGLKKGMLGA